MSFHIGRSAAQRWPRLALAVLTGLTLAATAHAQIKEQILGNPDPMDTQGFGSAVDISGDALIVGVPASLFEFLGQSGCGIYERVGGTWTLAYDAIDDFPVARNAGWDVAIEGEWAAFSVLGQNPATQGMVRILHRDAGGWVVTQDLTSPVAASIAETELFGSSVDISGTLLVVGAAYQEKAFVYRRSGSTWTHEATLSPPPGYVQADALFGYSAAVSQTPSREAVVIGQPAFDTVSPLNFDEDGAAHIFVKDVSLGWQLNTTVPPTAAPTLKSFLGCPVAIDGDIIALGATYSHVFEPPFTSNGAALLLRWNGSSFALSTTILGSDEEFAGGGLGVAGDMVYVGHPYWTGIDLDQSSGRITGHRWTGTGWAPWPASGNGFHRVEASQSTADFGGVLAVSGGRLVAGAASSVNFGTVHVINVAKEGWKWSDAAVGGLDRVVGSTGPATLIGEGSLGAGDGHRIHLHGAKPSTLITLFVGVSAINAPFKGGVLVPNPQFVLYVATNPAGNFHITTNFPGGAPPGVPLWHHMWWVDAGGPAGLASSNAIRGITP